MTITDDMVERSARELCRYTWERAGFGKQALDVYVDYNWKDHAVGARRSLTAALEGSVAVPAWLPIETAPKDGIAVLLWVPENKCTYCAYWRAHVVEPEVAGWHIFAGGWRAQLQWATLWQPVPTPPITRQERLTGNVDLGRPACGQGDEWGRKPTDPHYGEPKP
jgi:hypothetical protein